ncbi:aminotransferase class V-fold PLP-dependent enzyme [Paroceanicella profunda]|uniref:Cysteine desulfurase n=1 Tax=Paroceanicella profunda TaxID=2579971 RepID=A0A5B8G1J4_9RHOB|nr:aminotransferase class V-fold PLP-dependent enzyme [Paroceanicella profunda]QDL92952.1 aminotransferase class V-fold PLP-dependent enzyme [Paroceanicella profunda]
MSGRSYLDWNATAPLCAEARAAMVAALDVTGNPSSVHAEGRAARALLGRAREQVAALAGVSPEQVIFTSGATEGAALVAAQYDRVSALATEHDCVHVHATAEIGVDGTGRALPVPEETTGLVAIQAANSETGVLQAPRPVAGADLLVDAVQVFGRCPFDFAASGADWAIVSAHKLGGPKGVGAVIVKPGRDPAPLLRGGGQERRRRAGTENLVGVAGFGAAAAHAARNLATGVWNSVEERRHELEGLLRDAAPDSQVAGQGAPRLPNTVCLVTPGWRGETQVMQMDLAGFAVSAGSACSSGKVGPSRVLSAMGLDAVAASSSLRVSLGPDTTRDTLAAFAAAWTGSYRRFRRKAA